ncbi:MAG: serine/threonine-protein kinase [Acetobacteraceae bacterium]
MAEALPARIGRYEVEASLGGGAMGVILRARDPLIGRTVAIKLIRADLLAGEEREEFLSRFRREAQAAGRCTHPNIVTVHDFALEDGNPYLAMEYVAGESLAAILRRQGRLGTAGAAGLVAQVLDALAAAHAAGIIHRDIKPANILVLPDGRAKVTDFGIARLEGTAMTLSGAVLGTPSHMSPEQCRGEEVTAQSDLFSAGVVLFEALSGTRPFPGRSLVEMTVRLMDPAPAALFPALDGQPPPLVAVLARALAKRPEDRFASAGEMAAALRAAVAAPEAGLEETVGLARPGLSAMPDRAALDPAVLGTIERHLAPHVGPIARHLVREAARAADSLEALFETLGRSIPGETERAAFLAEVRRDSTGGTTGGAGGALPAGAHERVRCDLARILGPIASLLTRRAAPTAGSEAELRRRLAAHIEDTAEREAFLGGAKV